VQRFSVPVEAVALTTQRASPERAGLELAHFIASRFIVIAEGAIAAAFVGARITKSLCKMCNQTQQNDTKRIADTSLQWRVQNYQSGFHTPCEAGEH
jgi:hypothetical protein